MFKLKDGDAYEMTKDKPEGEKIDDKKLNKFVKNAIRGIKNIKEQDRANEIERISGGDTQIISEIEKIYDTNDETNIIRQNKPGKDGEVPNDYSLYDLVKDLKNPGEHTYISLNNLNEEQKKLFKLDGHGIGKGEYLLPMLFPDVYKSRSHGYEDDDTTVAKGDLLLLMPDDTFRHIELTSAGNAKSFLKNSNVPSKLKDDNLDDFKKLAAKSFTKYCMTRVYKDKAPMYYAIINNKISLDMRRRSGTEFDGLLIIYIGDTFSPVSNYADTDNYKQVLKSFQELIQVDNKFSNNSAGNYDFYYSYSGDENGKIVVNLSAKYSDKYSSRDDGDNKSDIIIRLLKQGYTIREIDDMVKSGEVDGVSDFAYVKIQKLRKQLEQDGFDFSDTQRSKEKDKLKEEKDKLKGEKKQAYLDWKEYVMSLPPDERRDAKDKARKILQNGEEVNYKKLLAELKGEEYIDIPNDDIKKKASKDELVKEIIRLAKEGKSNIEIARSIHQSEETTRNWIKQYNNRHPDEQIVVKRGKYNKKKYNESHILSFQEYINEKLSK